MIRAGCAAHRPSSFALVACAVLAGATSLPTAGEWIVDAPAHVLAQLGVRPDPVLPARQRPSESAVRRLPARIDGDAADAAVGRRLADHRPDAVWPPSCGRAAHAGCGRHEPAGRP
ncbi:transposase family protein [Streptomyces sp. STR69]|uniref:transposase family protein n=1 Tax=Streptomyces sp. STR69 TaxID=1796942 RepID=UPI0021C8C4EA|nr:transposase family protein [Streptomyces sp. STR69]